MNGPFVVRGFHGDEEEARVVIRCATREEALLRAALRHQTFAHELDEIEVREERADGMLHLTDRLIPDIAGLEHTDVVDDRQVRCGYVADAALGQLMNDLGV